MKNKKKKEKKDFLKHPVAALVLMFAWVQIADAILNSVLGSIAGVKSAEDILVDGKIDMDAAAAFAADPKLITVSIISMLLIYALFAFRLRKRYHGTLMPQDKNRMKPVLIVMGVLIAADVITALLAGGFDFSKLTYYYFVQALAAGVVEELSFRGMLVPHMFRGWNDEKHIWTIGILTSAAFGLYHLMNIAAGADLFATFVQIIFAMALGLLFYAMYMYTGSLVPCMVVHFLHDFLVFIVKSDSNTVVNTVGMSLSDILLNTGYMIAAVAGAAWFLQKSHRAEIAEMWNKKWSTIQ